MGNYIFDVTKRGSYMEQRRAYLEAMKALKDEQNEKEEKLDEENKEGKA